MSFNSCFSIDYSTLIPASWLWHVSKSASTAANSSVAYGQVPLHKIRDGFQITLEIQMDFAH